MKMLEIIYSPFSRSTDEFLRKKMEKSHFYASGSDGADRDLLYFVEDEIVHSLSYSLHDALKEIKSAETIRLKTNIRDLTEDEKDDYRGITK